MHFQKQNERVDVFLNEVIDVCRRNGFSISHEDRHGAFEIVPFSECDAQWLNAAQRDKLPEEKLLDSLITNGVKP